MTWHIFTKDLRRLWPYVAALAALHFAMAVIRAKLGPFPEDHPGLHGASQLLGILAGVMVFFAAVLVVQLDPLADDRQDWLVRPIRRRDLLGAKLLFLTLLVQAPMFVADLAQGLFSGFSAGQALGAAAAWNLYQFLNPVLPAMAIGAMTRTIGQTMGLGSAVLAGCAAAVFGVQLLVNELTGVTGLSATMGATLISWLIWTLLLLIGAAVILRLQYFRRETRRSRILFAVFTALMLASLALLPQSTALAMEHWLSPVPEISLAFAPEAGKPAIPARSEGPRFSEQNVRIALPLRVQGLPPDLMLVAESVKVSLTTPDGQSREQTGPQDVLLHMPGQPAAPSYLVLFVPRDFFRAHAGEPLRVALEYRLGLLRPVGHYDMPASAGDLLLPEGARCATKIIPSGTHVLMGCLQAGAVHTRIAAVLKFPETGGSGVENWALRHLPSDAPYSNGADMITQFNFSLPLGAATQLPRVAIVTARPQTHLIRQVVISGARLEDWKADTATAEGSESRNSSR